MRNLFLRYTLHSDFIIYTIRVLIGFLIGYPLFVSFPQYSVSWTLISIILVISPQENESKKIAIDRAKSNFIGSAIGLSLYFVPIQQLYAMVIGILASLITCKVLNIIAVARTSMVALIIVYLHEQESRSYFAALDRFGCVCLGCLIGLSVILSTRNIILKLRKRYIF
ncbi:MULTISPECIES: FUSC family protein [unclassified Sphingobacterium]|uniref:FUSC family protein n=1 Tax=unclassified Sphingobacterium TaxID=2609468 RepID=UPI001AE479B0|nr:MULTISPECIES: FUSC family protein [unclassified Sphingobacterium]MDR6736746.1 putative membrane protein YccC [Sphingobacterium sp. 2149]